MSAERVFAAVLAFVLSSAAWAGLDIQHWTTPQGARVVFVENHELPMLDVSVNFSAGSARDSREKSGLASLTRHLMGLGAGPYAERHIAEQLADVGGLLSGHLDADRAGFSLRTLSAPAQRDPALAILKAILTAPAFDPAILAREQARVIAGLEEAATKPETVGEKAFQAALFGPHPYALEESGEVDSVRGLTREDLADFHRRHYRARNMVLAVMGDISRPEVEAWAIRLAEGLPPGEAPAPLAPVAPLAQGTEQVLPHHATQSHLFVGQPGLKREDPDYFPLLVGNYILGGGGFDSRLTESIRQKQGLAYSVYSYFVPMAERGPFRIGLQTKRESTRQALDSVRAELARFLAEGPTEAELVQAKNNLIGSFPLRIDSNRKILDHLAMIGFYRLPLNWLETYSPSVAAVSREDILRAFRARVRPEAMVTVIVGGQREAQKQ